MDDLIKLIRTCRLTAGLAERIRQAEEIFHLIEPNLRLFAFSSVFQNAATDALQEVFKAVATGTKKFEGGTANEFWGWCYRIARNKLKDHYRSKAADRMQPMPPEELWQMMELWAQDAPIFPAVRHDLECAMKLLTSSKPECYDFLWKHFVFGLGYAEIAEEQHLSCPFTLSITSSPPAAPLRLTAAPWVGAPLWPTLTPAPAATQAAVPELALTAEAVCPWPTRGTPFAAAGLHASPDPRQRLCLWTPSLRCSGLYASRAFPAGRKGKRPTKRLHFSHPVLE